MARTVTVDDMSCENSKVVLVTGASSGIGEATVRALLDAGHRVYGAARRVEKMEPLAQTGASIHFLDVTDEESMTKLVDDIIAKEGRIDTLVNNAGFGVYGSVEDVEIDEARRQFEVNLFGLARMTQLVLPHMRAQQNGTIVNVSSMGGKVYTPVGAWYHATKHALEGWSDCLRIEVEQFGIKVVIVEPGAIETDFAEIAIEPLLERSKGGPYLDLAGRMAKATRDTYESGKASPASLVADVIAKAIEAKKPKTRYATGFLAKPILITRRLLGDRLYDRMIHKFL